MDKKRDYNILFDNKSNSTGSDNLTSLNSMIDAAGSLNNHDNVEFTDDDKDLIVNVIESVFSAKEDDDISINNKINDDDSSEKKDIPLTNENIGTSEEKSITKVTADDLRNQMIDFNKSDTLTSNSNLELKIDDNSFKLDDSSAFTASNNGYAGNNVESTTISPNDIDSGNIKEENRVHDVETSTGEIVNDDVVPTSVENTNVNSNDIELGDTKEENKLQEVGVETSTEEPVIANVVPTNVENDINNEFVDNNSVKNIITNSNVIDLNETKKENNLQAVDNETNITVPISDDIVPNNAVNLDNNINTNVGVIDGIGVNSTPIIDINTIDTSVNNISLNDNDTNIQNNDQPVMPEKVLLENNMSFDNTIKNTNDIISNAIYYDVATNCYIDANGNQYYNQNFDNVNTNINIQNNNMISDYDNSYRVKIVKQKPSLFRMIVNVFSYTLFILLLILGIILLFYFVDQKVRQARGDTTPSKYNAYVVLTGSMIPTININDVVVTKYIEPKDLEKNDIITFYSEYYNLNVTHRIIDIYYDDTTNEYMFKTKGDANNSEDFSLLNGTDIYGRVILKIPKLGYVQNFLARDGGWIIVILIPSLAILSYDIMKLFKMAGTKTKILNKR